MTGLHQGTQARISYEQSGDGPDLVWVAGGGTSGADWRLFQTPWFDQFFRCTTYDNRGIGETTCEIPQPWPLEAFAGDAAELIEAVCDPPVTLMGAALIAGFVAYLARTRTDVAVLAPTTVVSSESGA